MNAIQARGRTAAWMILGIVLPDPSNVHALSSVNCEAAYGPSYQLDRTTESYQIVPVGESVSGHLVSGYKLYDSPQLTEASKLAPKEGSRMRITGRRKHGEPYAFIGGGYARRSFEEIYRVSPMADSEVAYIRARDIAIKDSIPYADSDGFEIWSSGIALCAPAEPYDGMIEGDFHFMLTRKGAAPIFVGLASLSSCRPGRGCLFLRALPGGEHEGAVFGKSGENLWRSALEFSHPVWAGDAAIFMKGNSDDMVYRADLKSGETKLFYRLPDSPDEELQMEDGDSLAERGAMTYDEVNRTLSASFMRLKAGGQKGRTTYEVVLNSEGVLISSRSVHDSDYRP